MSRVVDVSVVCERCKARHPLGDPKLERWQLDVPLRVTLGTRALQVRADYCEVCAADLLAFLPGEAAQAAATTTDGTYVCDQPGCGRTFQARSGLANHLNRIHGILGPGSRTAKPKPRKRKPTRRVAFVDPATGLIVGTPGGDTE